MKSNLIINGILALSLAFAGCDSTEDAPTGKNPDTAEIVAVDRFSDSFATLFKRSANPEMPATNAPVDFDVAPFKTQSYGPDGQIVRYYNFDVNPLPPAPIYVLFKAGSDSPVAGQLNIIDLIPGEAGYNDFWQVYKVTVPDGYVANQVTSFDEILSNNYAIEILDKVVNCPVVPYGSTADENLNGQPNTLFRGWYKGKVVYYFSFEEKDLVVTNNGLTPLSPVYVTFNVNPDSENPQSGPASGVKFEENGVQSHNVIETLPDDADYSPLWSVQVYDNADFNNVSNLQTAKTANILMRNAMNVNCPVVYIGSNP